MKQVEGHEATAGWWVQGDRPPETGADALRAAIVDVVRPLVLIRHADQTPVCRDGRVIIGGPAPEGDGVYPLAAYVPPLHPGSLGDPLFKKAFGLDYAYVVGAMANGITSAEMVEAAGQAGLIGFFGAAGLSPDEIEAAIDRIQPRLNTRPYGFNLIHTPNEPDLEDRVVELYLRRAVTLVSASAYMDMTPPLIYFRVKGIRREPDGRIVCPNRIMAKASRVEVARKFFSPPPEKLLQQLVQQGQLSAEEAELSRYIPVADALTAEADSGGHTDNRPAISLLPTMLALRDEMAARHHFDAPLFVGLGGGVATPDSTAAAFAMGAAFVLTGSINQACVEAGTSESVRLMLAEADQADVVMAPAADMFELGVKVQVLKRGTMFPFRAAKLYDLYSRYPNYDAIPSRDRAQLERDYFRGTFEQEWARTRDFFSRRDPAQIQRAEQDPRHRMALVFRSYLGQSSNWANAGEPSRKLDYQIWCGPAMGAFNRWTRGSFLAKPENRRTVTVALNLLLGAAVATRVAGLRHQGILLGFSDSRYLPLEVSEIKQILSNG